jgi:hypothetical protein
VSMNPPSPDSDLSSGPPGLENSYSNMVRGATPVNRVLPSGEGEGEGKNVGKVLDAQAGKGVYTDGD